MALVVTTEFTDDNDLTAGIMHNYNRATNPQNMSSARNNDLVGCPSSEAQHSPRPFQVAFGNMMDKLSM